MFSTGSFREDYMWMGKHSGLKEDMNVKRLS